MLTATALLTAAAGALYMTGVFITILVALAGNHTRRSDARKVLAMLLSVRPARRSQPPPPIPHTRTGPTPDTP